VQKYETKRRQVTRAKQGVDGMPVSHLLQAPALVAIFKQ